MGRILAQVLIASRWLMAPLYLGLIAALIVVVVEFFKELIHTIVGFAGLNADATIFAVLKLIDLVLIGNLILIMIVAGIGTLTTIARSDDDAPLMQFMGKVDFSALKLKVIVSLVAIAAVDLLESFVEINSTDKTDLMWQIAILATFVVSGVLLAWMDRLHVGHE
ncbi:MAG: YqhA family protein [Stellaceae bacterium]